MTRGSLPCGDIENCHTFSELLKICVKKKDLAEGIRLHDDVLKRGLLQKSPYLASILITLYSKCGLLSKSIEVHEGLVVRNTVSWSALISAYAREAQGHEALNCFEQMQNEGFSPDDVTFTSVLKACSSTRDIDKGKEIHEEIVSRGFFKKSIALGTALLDMYMKCGMLMKGWDVLEELPERNEVSWSAVIAGFAQQGHVREAFDCFLMMHYEGLSPDSVTFTCILKSCGCMYALEEGELIHDQIVKRGLLKKDNFLSNALVNMYAKCGALAKAQQVHDEFRAQNIISWSSLISGYAEHGQGHEALKCFRRMQLEGISPDIITFVCILKACCGTLAIHKGQQIHHEIVSRGLIEKNGVLGNALVDMYAKCGVLPKAQQVHDNLEGRNVVSWSALIAGYVEHGQGREALNCFDRMQNEEGLYPNAITFTCILKACTITGAIDKGKEIHELILRRGLLEKDIVLGNALVDMYAKCGMFEKALEVHEEIPVRTIISSNALIAGYAQKGRGHEALDCFRRMQCERLSPDDITFLCVLNACSQSGLVDEAEVLFRSMKEEYSIAPSIEHHTWMVLIFASVGNFDKAVFMIQTMPATRGFCPIWHALLGGCRKWGNVELGRLAFDHVLWLDNTCAAAYVQMSSIYAAAGMHENAKSVDLMRLKNAVSEKPESIVWVDSSGNTHSFFICENTSSK